MTLPRSVSFSADPSGCPMLTVRHPAATGTVALLGGQVLAWTPAAAACPVLYQSPQATYEEGKPIRGGIPICWPWFGPRQGLPAHGLVRTRLWELREATERAEGVSLFLGFASDPGTLEIWPHPFSLELEVFMGRDLSVSLSMTNPGKEPVAVTGALHTYLGAGDITRTVVEGLDGAVYTDSIDENRRKEQRGPVRFDGEVDRIYETTGSVRVEDAVWNRVVRVSKTGSAATVVWNPWIEKSQRLADLPDEAYLHFLCIEAANAGADVVTLEPGGRHILGTRIELL